MRYTSSRKRHFVLLALGVSAASVVAAWVVSAAIRGLFLPVGANLGDEPLSLFFFLFPIAVMIYAGVCRGHSSGFVTGIAFLTAATTFVLSWVVWIAWLIAICQGGGCD